MEDNELIAKFMGLTHKTVVTVYNYGMDFRHSYDEEVVYSNKPPKLKRYEEKFVNQILNVYDNFFESDNQEDDFEYTSFLAYELRWDNLMPVVHRCYHEHMSPELAEAVMTCDIDLAYKAVVKFIKEYYGD